MSEFRSLYAALKGWYCRPLADYPTDLREWVDGKWKVPLAHRVEGHTPAYPGEANLNPSKRKNWDDLTPAQRIAYAKQWDHTHNPTTKARRDEINRFYDNHEKLIHEIARWENANAPTVMDLAKRDEILKPLKDKLEVMDSKRRQMLGDPDDEREATIDAQGDANEAMPPPDETESEVQGESTDLSADRMVADLFDPVSVAALSKMFPDDKWPSLAERARRNGLDVARTGRRVFNPYLAATWWLNRQKPTGWDLARVRRTLANNLPTRSLDLKHLVTGDIE
jgi:hypothetical protein